MHKLIGKILLTLGFILPLYSMAAQSLDSPVGRWVTLENKTGERSGIVELYETNGKLNGKIITIFPGKDRDPKGLCKKCPGNFKDKPVQGLVFVWDFVKQPDGSYAHGKLLDPKQGKIYQGTITLIHGGKQLQLKGYWGPFYRTQTWQRAS